MLNNIIKFQDYFLGIMKHSITSDTINWNNIIKKEVRGINDTYLGKVKGISEPFLITEKGSIIKEKFYIPKNLLEGYDDIIVYCRISEREARNNFMRNLQPLHADYYSNYNYSNYKITEINKEDRLQYNIDENNAKIILLYTTKQHLSKIQKEHRLR
jgi:hypothetical protein